MRAWNLSYGETDKLLQLPEIGSPVFVYDEEAVRVRANEYTKHMVVGGKACQNYFAVKALPNPAVLEIVRSEGMGFDASDSEEIDLSVMAGAEGEEIIFTSNNTTDEEFDQAAQAGAMINFDDLSHVRRYLGLRAERGDGPLPIAFCRSNPGDINFEGVNSEIIGKPSETKFGMPDDQIVEAYRLLKESGVERFGLHTMLLSNELDHKNHLAIAKHMFTLAKRINMELGIVFEKINLGGGFGVAYRPGEKEFDVATYGRELDLMYRAMDMGEVGAPQIITENGRWVSGDAGFLLTRVINRKETHRTFVGVDTSIQNLLRAGIYSSAYHHMTVLSQDPNHSQEGRSEIVDVSGSLCEGNDVLAKQRELPKIHVGDIMVIHTAGAHAIAMAYNYNAKRVAGEILLLPDGTPRAIRRAQTKQDLRATLII